MAVALVAFSAFVDIVAYSIAVPVLPDLGRRLGASPTMIGLLFASFGVTVLLVSIPMGAASDRTGRKLPLVAGLAALSVATIIFGLAERLPALFAARLVQGAADAVTWVVGFALLADLYKPAERGRVMGIVMGAASFGFIIGPSIGGWLYQLGGVRLPFFALGAAAALAAVGFMFLDTPAPVSTPPVPILSVLRTPAVAACAATVAILGGTLAMLEPVFSMFLAARFGFGPARIGLVFGAAAAVAALLHPIFGRLADRVGPRRLMMAGTLATGLVLPLLGRTWSFESAAALNMLQAAAASVVITPSLAYMAEGVSGTGAESFGMAYGVYNFAWALGLLAGPALGGFLFERIGFELLTMVWAPIVVAPLIVLVRTRAPRAAVK